MYSFTLCNPPGSKQYLIVMIVGLKADPDFVSWGTVLRGLITLVIRGLGKRYGG